MEYRAATADDVTAISALHAESWRLHYRGGFPDEFLDGDVGAERLAVWTARLADPSPRDRTVVAMEGPELAGFVHTILDDDPEWGALLDNLHVRSTRKRRGTGACLLRRAAADVVASGSGSGLYLWVLEANEPAKAFYVAQGGELGDRERFVTPGDGSAVGIRVVWPDPAVLL